MHGVVRVERQRKQRWESGREGHIGGGGGVWVGKGVARWGRGWLDDGFTQYVSAAVETTWWIHT